MFRGRVPGGCSGGVFRGRVPGKGFAVGFRGTRDLIGCIVAAN